MAYKSNKIVGYLLILIGLLINPWIMRLLFSDFKISSTSLVFIILIDISLIILGIFVVKIGDSELGRKKIYSCLAYAIVVLILIEIVLRLFVLILPINFDDSDPIESRLKISSYQNEWGKDYWKEFYELKTKYVPYLGWDRIAYEGQYININDQGVRKTWQPENDLTNAKELFIFGGSALWGTGARDDYTIPSYVVKLFNENNYNIRVTNFGESGYTFLQELIQLELLLHDGAHPDYVIFYDGANDVEYAYAAGEAGALYNEKGVINKIS